VEAVTAAATRVLHEGAATLLTLVAVVRSAATAVVVDDVLVDEELRVVAVEPMETGVVEVTVVAVVSPSESGKDGGVKSSSASLSSSTAITPDVDGISKKNDVEGDDAVAVRVRIDAGNCSLRGPTASLRGPTASLRGTLVPGGADEEADVAAMRGERRVGGSL